MYKNFDELPITMSVNEAADALGVSSVSLYKLIDKDKDFPVITIGRRKVVPKEQLKDWIDKNCKR